MDEGQEKEENIVFIVHNSDSGGHRAACSSAKQWVGETRHSVSNFTWDKDQEMEP